MKKRYWSYTVRCDVSEIHISRIGTRSVLTTNNNNSRRLCRRQRSKSPVRRHPTSISAMTRSIISLFGSGMVARLSTRIFSVFAYP